MGGCLSFAEILRHLGDTGDKGDIPHGQRLHGEATQGRQGATFEATTQPQAAIVAPVAHLSPSIEPAPQGENRPCRPCRPALDEIPKTEARPRTPQSCSTCAHVTGRGGCGEPVAAGLSDREGVIYYHPKGGTDCPAWKGTSHD